MLICPFSEAQQKIKGSLGVDLHALSSSSESNTNSYSKVDGTRFLSNHYVSLSNGGFIKNENFASYSLYTTFKGYFTSTNTGMLKKSSYSSPTFNTLRGSITFFPSRTYPLRFFYLKMKDVTLRYTETNRSKVELLTPSLAVLQKSRIDEEKYGSTFSSNLFKGASIKAFYNNSSNKNAFDYDFDENKNIVVTANNLPGDIFSNTIPVIFSNNLTDDSVRIISGLINEILPPGFTTTLVFDTGLHFIDIIPLHIYRQSSIRINMIKGQRYSIVIDKEKFPAGSENIEESTDSKFEFNYGGGDLKLFTSYSYEDAFRVNVGVKEKEQEFENSFKYDISRKFNLGIDTRKNKRENIRNENDNQITNIFNNKSTLNFTQRKGIIGNLSHDYSKGKVEYNDGNGDATNSTIFTSSVSLPSERYKHNISLNGEIGKQDQSGKVSSDISDKSLDLSNRMELFFKNIKLIPFNSTKISSQNRIDDSLKTDINEINISSSLEASQTKTRYLGDISSKFGYTYNKSTQNSETLKNSSYMWELRLSKNISEKQSISFNTSHTWAFSSDMIFEVFDSLTQQAIKQSVPVPSQYTNASSIGYRSSQFEDIDFSTTLTLTNSVGNKTIDIAILLDAYIPFINIPFSTELSNQSRDLEGLPKQSTFETETSILYSYNQIKIRISHIYSKEILVLDTYKFYEFSVNITRNFGFY